METPQTTTATSAATSASGTSGGDAYPLARGPLPAFGWACYLGSSWTWIIGMVFPAFLLRDFGWAGYAAFAIPNVLGAAAMGTVLKNSQNAASLVAKHRGAMKLFSDVTLSYHVFVLFWLLFRIYGEWFLLLVPPVAAAMFFFTSKGSRNIVRLAMVVSFIAFGIGLMNWLQPITNVHLGHLPEASPTLGTKDLLLFIPASIAGFVCCPYLDLTFERARIETGPGTGRWAFGIGFCVVFFSMILFAASYASKLEPYLTNDALAPEQTQAIADLGGALSTTLLPTVAAFFFVQVCFTLCVHLQERIRVAAFDPNATPAKTNKTKSDNAKASAPNVKSILPVVLWLAAGAGLGLAATTDQASGESIYRSYLLWYGTVFPLYVWLLMVKPFRPAARLANPVTRKRVWQAAAVLAYVFGYFGYVEFETWGAVAAIAVFVLGRLAIEALPRDRALA